MKLTTLLILGAAALATPALAQTDPIAPGVAGATSLGPNPGAPAPAQADVMPDKSMSSNSAAGMSKTGMSNSGMTSTAWAMTIAIGVNKMPSEPNGPARESRR